MLIDADQEAVAMAVDYDHPPDLCGTNTCDISAAMRYGFPFVAAFLLQGATETPALDDLPDHVRERFSNVRRGLYGDPEGWVEWTEAFEANAVECAACRAFAFPEHPGDEPPTTCGNCLATLPDREGVSA